VTPADYDPFCITAPTDARLPGGGGNQVCDLADIRPEKFGLVDNVVTQASHFGNRREVYDGVDAALSARFARGGLFSAGTNFGRTALECVVVDNPIQFCKTAPPFFLPELKFSVSYPLPWDLQASAVMQNLPGLPVSASHVATNAAIAPSLGRNLVGRTFALVELMEPNQEYEDRVSQLDLRFAKTIRLGRASVKGMFDIYNIFNEDAVGFINSRYGASWLLPTEVMAGRLFKFGAQVDF
jgi:hypothetical protein